MLLRVKKCKCTQLDVNKLKKFIFSAGQLRARDAQQDRLTMIALADGSQVSKYRKFIR